MADYDFWGKGGGVGMEESSGGLPVSYTPFFVGCRFGQW